MLTRRVRFDDRGRRTDSEPDSGATAELSPLGSGGAAPGRSRRLRAVLLFVALILVLTGIGAADGADATPQNVSLTLTGTSRKFDIRSRDLQASAPGSLVEQVRFNQKPVLYQKGVRVGPGSGTLEIQFAPSTSSEYLRYRLLGFDAVWREAGPDRNLLRYHLVPGRYEFDFQGESRHVRSSDVARIPIIVMAPYWQTAQVQSTCILFLLLLILLLHRLRVRYLNRKNQKLQETVNQTRAELTLTARTARDAQEALKEQALKDVLTGLWNRRAAFAMLEKELYRAQRDRFPVTLVMIDLDHFKNINDTFGHPTGDEVLREAARRLVEVMRPYDFIGRYGGEEFLVVLPSCSSHSGMLRAEEFRRVIAARPVVTAAGLLAVTCSLGVAAFDDATPPDDLIHRADEALYRAKHMGRNCVCAANPGKGPARVDGARESHARGDQARAG